MEKRISATVLLLIVIVSGCASTSDYNRLRLEFEQLKRETEQDRSTIQGDMAMFKKTYNPELQKTFSDNVTEAENYRENIDGLNKNIQETSEIINDLLRESQNDRTLIDQNLKESEAENVVNEFRQLNRQWEATLFELSNIVKESQKAVSASGRAAMHASEKAASAQTSADYAVESMNRIYDETRHLGKMQEKIKNLEIKVRKINRQLSVDESSKGKEHNNKKSVQKRIEELEKLLNELKSEIRKDNKKHPRERKNAG